MDRLLWFKPAGHKLGTVWLLFPALFLVCVTWANSFLLAIFLLLPLLFVQIILRTLPCFLSVWNTAQSSSVLGFNYRSINISKETENSTSLQPFLGAVSIYSREYCGQVNMKFGNGLKERGKGLFSEQFTCSLGIMWILHLLIWTFSSHKRWSWWLCW